MSCIKRLSESTINLISAGEVVVNPASVVKELVENSIDAKAKKVEIWLENGGKTFIVVKDDGIGMSREDLHLSVERYTTSKLDQNDLYNIATLGFRGEALASILAVSKVSITTRHNKGHDAYKLIAGQELQSIPVVADFGTKIEVRDLFYTTPARLKFLKSDKAEASLCVGVIKNMAIAYPHIEFICYLDHREVFFAPCLNNLPRHEAFRSRAALIFGQDFLNSSIPINLKEGVLSLSGLISVPTYNRASSFEQIFFVNSRFVRDPILKSALKRAYSDLVPQNRHSVVILSLEIDPYFIDVNVHPAKTEVRFRSPKEISDLIVGGIKSVIGSSAHLLMESANLNVSFDWNHSPSYSEERNFENSFRETHKLFEPSPQIQVIPRFELNSGREGVNSFPLGLACFQFNGTFIVSRTEDSIVITDQHAAHERIVYESIKESFLNKSLETQPLLQPLKINIYSDINAFIENREILKKFGLHIDVQEKESFILVNSVPLLLAQSDVTKIIRDLEDDFALMQEMKSMQDKSEYICKTWACHHSIRANRALSIDEMNQILRMIESTSNAGQCNHGRPSYIKFKNSQIAKWFERI
jgi:DNA mismatch repair protein MutL